MSPANLSRQRQREDRKALTVFLLPVLVALLATQNCEPPHIHLGGEVACRYWRPDHCRWVVVDGGCDLYCLERPPGQNITAPKELVKRPMGFRPNGPLDGGDWIDWGPGGPDGK